MSEDQIVMAVHQRIAEGGGATSAQLAEAAGVSEAAARKAVGILRVQFPPDSQHHPVSYKGAYWPAHELSALGLDVQLSRTGKSLKVVAPPKEPQADGEKKKRGRPPKAPYQGMSRDEIADSVQQLLAGSPDAGRVLQHVLQCVDESFAARQGYRDAVADAGELKKHAEAVFKEVVEEGRGAGDTQAALQKLHAIEMQWQALEEKKAEGIEMRKDARERKKRADARLEGLMENLRQCEFDFGEAEAA